MKPINMPALVCVGGGHGLGRLMTALAGLGENLTGVVTTTDNGGSTGRLRQESGTIAWGDVRNCLNQLCTQPGVGQLLFEYRFATSGELNGHNLGNLMLYALDQMSVRPTDAIQIMRELLQIKPQLYPMSEDPVSLVGTYNGERIVGEVEVDRFSMPFDSLSLSASASLSVEVESALNQADAIVLAPGSFMTSVLPPLLVDGVPEIINQSSAQLVLVGNVTGEVIGGSDGGYENSGYEMTLARQLELIAGVGVRLPDVIIWPEERGRCAELSLPTSGVSVVVTPLAGAEPGRHDPVKLERAVMSLFD